MSKLKEMIKRKKDQGFTLIELMIVIAVIGILAIVLVPKVGSIKSTAKTAGIDTNVRLVQGYVMSRISTWSENTTTWTDDKIAADIKGALTASTDQIKNPFAPASSGTAIADLLKTVPDSLALNDAVQIVNTSAAAVAATSKGTVVVVVPATSPTAGITIEGRNNNGEVSSSVIITP